MSRAIAGTWSATRSATLATLSSHRLIVDDLIAAHNGRITGTAGDSVLAEFASVVDAVDCAVEDPGRLAAANESQPPEHRLLFRIGINVGDVMVKDGDIFGDGVNIAARLEALAEPGGICVSRGVRDHVRKMGRYAFEDLGEQSVKNIAQPIRAFRVLATARASPGRRRAGRDPAPHGQPPAPEPSATRRRSSSLSGTRSRTARIRPNSTAYLEQYPRATSRRAGRGAPQSRCWQNSERPSRCGSSRPIPILPAIELAFWDSVKESEDPAEFTAYLENIRKAPSRPLPRRAGRR